MVSVHLSISKHSVIFLLKEGEVFFFLYSIIVLIIVLLPPSAPAFFPVSFICSPLPLLLHPSPFSFYLFFTSLLLPLFPNLPLFCPFPLPCSASHCLSVEQHIQQQNKAAYSITHCLIKQDQNAAALASTQQHNDTRQHWDISRGDEGRWLSFEE